MYVPMAVAGFVLGVAGCGDDKGENTTTSTPTIKTNEAPPAPTGQGTTGVGTTGGTTTDDDGGNSGKGGGGGGGEDG